jgi:hypothetical protein
MKYGKYAAGAIREPGYPNYSSLRNWYERNPIEIETGVV